MTAYYNEIDPFAADWLQELIKGEYIAYGEVDTRSIEDVVPGDLRGFTQCHFFAGIGGWSYALRLAGWPDDRPVWTGSCPCQPFSSAGKGAGFADERHLWPAFFHLISQCRPVTVFGEQVASKDGLTWLDLVQTDMEGSGYTFWAVDTCAAGFGAPEKGQRLFWAGENWMGQADSERLFKGMQTTEAAGHRNSINAASWIDRVGKPNETKGFWRDADWLLCKGCKWRPVEPGTFPMVDGFPGSLEQLRCYGNAIVPQQAQAFVKAFLEANQ